ncbi:hypothetical protein DRO60_04290 [Candidatus Bathyarchaeota archaeon]|nr:MAG: hypothetical protein DRO60_04290 [Candidatus Bathyarchaeota archaeon]
MAWGEGGERSILSNPVYLAKKAHEAKRFGERAKEIKPDKVLEAAGKRSRFYKGIKISGLVLDVGCGYGPDALAILNSCACEVVGFDISLGALELAGEVLKGRSAHLLAADASSMPFRDGAFDVANVSYMLHHHPWPVIERIASELARVLKPGGKLVVREPCPSDERGALVEEVWGLLHELGALKDLGQELSTELRGFLHLCSTLFGFGWLYPTALEQLLRSKGFEVVRLEFWNEERDLSALLDSAEERARELDFDEAERAFIRARLDDLREKMNSLGFKRTRERRLFLVAIKGEGSSP